MSARTPETAIVLAAGLGTRMRPLTDEKPKPLIEVGGKALIDHTLDALVAVGVRRAIVNVHWLAGQVEAHVARRTDLEVLISDERGALLETGGGLVKAAPKLGRAPIFVCNTDQVFLPNGAAALQALVDAWRPWAMDAVLLLAPQAATSGFSGAGDFFLAPEGRLARRGTAGSAPFVYTGLQMFDPAILAGWPEEAFSLNRIWDLSLRRARLFGAVHAGRFLHVGDPGGLQEAERALADERGP